MRFMNYWRNRLLLILLPLLLILVPFTPAQAAKAQENITVSFLDVGQGDAAVIQSDGHTMMIDGGDAEASSYIYSWLKKNNITSIDYMVATHPDADHIGGLSGALQYAKVQTAWCPTTTWDTKTFHSLEKYLAAQGKKLTVPKAGTQFSLGKAKVQVLGPLSMDGSTNNTSIVLKVTYGQTSFLFTGDAEREEEEELLASGYNLKSTVLKVGHHGSDTSTSYLFLRTVDPDDAVISVGADNTYGHPSEDVLSRLRDAKVKTFRTDMQGTITAVSDGKKVTFTTQKNADADTLSGAGAGQNNADSGQTSSAGTENSRSASVRKGANGGTSSESAKTYVLNTSTHKFHNPDCSSVAQMKAKNKKVVTQTRDQLISEGYAPCKRCNP